MEQLLTHLTVEKLRDINLSLTCSVVCQFSIMSWNKHHNLYGELWYYKTCLWYLLLCQLFEDNFLEVNFQGFLTFLIDKSGLSAPLVFVSVRLKEAIHSDSTFVCCVLTAHQLWGCNYLNEWASVQKTFSCLILFQEPVNDSCFYLYLNSKILNIHKQ